jgi:hypothetical protein
MQELIEFRLFLVGGVLFALGLLLIGNEGFYFLLRNLLGHKEQQPDSPTPIWSPQNYPRYLIGITIIAIGLALIHLWKANFGG